MRKFIISDLHGFGNLYYKIMNYLDKLSEHDEIELYINGDLIDRGNESVEILIDVINRIKENKPNFKIEYLGGNHELMMHEVYEKREKGLYVLPFESWFLKVNGGKKTDKDLTEYFNSDKDKILEVAHFISNLNIYHKFPEIINNKNIVLVHAACPLKVQDECDLKIKDRFISYYVWAREDGIILPFKCRIGHKDYFTIVGHTPNNYAFGYYLDEDDNYLNIDGGCGPYAQGYMYFDHFPLLEVCDGYLKILTFNQKCEIIYGNYFDGHNTPFTDEELAKVKELV